MTRLPPPALPDGYRARPATVCDVPAIHSLVSACEGELLDTAGTGVDAVAAGLALPGLDPLVDTLLVHGPAGDAAAWARVDGGRRCSVDVHPDHRKRGLGGLLLGWVEERARAAGGERLAQTVPDGDTAAVALLRAHGYGPFVVQWHLEIALPTTQVVPDPPSGVTVRPFRPGDAEEAHRLTEDAFDAWQKRRKSYEEWAELTVASGAFAPDASYVATLGGEMVGAVLALDLPASGEGFVERIAVRDDMRRRGVARVLLGETFRAFHRRGRHTCTLWTHSEADALPLYERLGMTVRRSTTLYGKALPVRSS